MTAAVDDEREDARRLARRLLTLYADVPLDELSLDERAATAVELARAVLAAT